jgi:sec-independent protein translocase protein TatB
VFNLSGSEIVIIMLLALVILGPEKLPDAMRKAGKAWGELRKLSSGFQDEVRKGFEEPTREVRQTAAAVKKAATFDLSPTKGAVKSLLDPPKAARVSKQGPEQGEAAAAATAEVEAQAQAQEPAADQPPTEQPAPDHPTTEPPAEGDKAAEVDTTP